MAFTVTGPVKVFPPVHVFVEERETEPEPQSAPDPVTFPEASACRHWIPEATFRRVTEPTEVP